MTAPCICPTCNRPMPVADLIVDPGAGNVALKGDVVHLPRKVFLVFQQLLAVYPNPKSRDRLFDGIYSDRFADDDFPEPEVIRVWIHRLRKLIARLGMRVRTVAGFGYALEMPA